MNEQKSRFLGMLWGTPGATWLGNLLTDKGVLRLSKGKTKADKGTIRAGEVSIRIGQNC